MFYTPFFHFCFSSAKAVAKIVAKDGAWRTLGGPAEPRMVFSFGMVIISIMIFHWVVYKRV